MYIYIYIYICVVEDLWVALPVQSYLIGSLTAICHTKNCQTKNI